MPDRVDRGRMRRANLALLVHRLHLGGPCTRAALTATSGLSRSAVRDLLAELARRGLVCEGPPVTVGQRGRPSPLVMLRSERVVALAVDIEVETIAVATYGLGGEQLAFERVRQTGDPADPDTVVRAIAPLVRRQRTALRTDQLLAGVGIAIAGVVRAADGLVHTCPNLGWRDVHLGQLLHTAFDQPGVPVVVGNEADLGALGEWRRGAGRGASDLVYLSSEVGVGAGIISGGRPFAGSAGYAGEVGHVPVNPRGLDCRCGGRGCWETEAASEALVRRAAEHGATTLSAAAVLDDAAAGNPRAIAAVADLAHWAGRGLAGIVNILNPERIVLGGVLAGAAALAHDVLEAVLAEHALDCSRRAASIVPSTLGDRAQLVGAAEQVLTAVLDDPASVPYLSDRPTLAVATTPDLPVGAAAQPAATEQGA